jgi:hypothetical protein
MPHLGMLLFTRRIEWTHRLVFVVKCLAYPYKSTLNGLKLCFTELFAISNGVLDQVVVHVQDFLGIDQVHEVVLVELLNVGFAWRALAVNLTDYLELHLLVDNTWIGLAKGIDIFFIETWVQAVMETLQDVLHELSGICVLVEVELLRILSGVIQLKELSSKVLWFDDWLLNCA